MFGPPKNRILKWIFWADFHQASSKRWNLTGSLCSAAQSETGKLPPTLYLECLKFVTNQKLTISDFPQCLILRVHEEQIVTKARVKKRQFLRVQVIVKVRGARNPSHYIRLYPACRLNARWSSIVRKCMLLFVFPLSHDAWQHIHIILMQCFEPQYLG
jgi:hypothetical protein